MRSPRRSATRSGSPSSASTSRHARATSATRGPTSARRGACSAGSRGSRSATGCASPPRRCSRVPEPERVKVLRVIARLNMGGPALHVAYLTAGLRERGYDTTLVAGSLARGEDSMDFIADGLDVDVIRIDE